MCGIVTKIWHKPIDSKDAIENILEMYTQQRSRGTDGFGFMVIKKNLEIARYRATTEQGITKMLKDLDGDILGIIFHHRFPTSTANLVNCAHPIKVNHKDLKYDYYAIHNGVIYNCDDIKDKHDELGYKYETQYTEKTAYQFIKGKTKNWETQEVEYYNDSEAIAVEAARYLENKIDVFKPTGSYAVVMLQVDKETKRAVTVHYFRNTSSPLIMDKQGILCLRSEKRQAGFVYDTNTYATSDSVVPFDISTLDLKTGKTTTKEIKLPPYTQPKTTTIYNHTTGTTGGVVSEYEHEEDYGYDRRYNSSDYENDKNELAYQKWIESPLSKQENTCNPDLELYSEICEEIDMLYDDLEGERDSQARDQIQKRINSLMADKEVYAQILDIKDL